jgi:hypothetical protein
VQKKHEKQGFVLIAMHRQAASLKDKVMNLARSAKINYTVTQGGSVQGDAGGGIPRAYLFDWKGKCVQEGHPSEMYSKIDTLMAKAPPFITGGKDFTSPAVAKIAGSLRSPKGYGKALDQLAKLAGQSGTEAEEAKYLSGRIVGYGEGILKDAASNESEDALAAMRGYSEASKLFKGHEIGTKAAKRMKELKKDKPFQNELKAAKLVAQMEYFAGQFKAVGGQVNPQHPANRKPFAGIVKLYKKLKKKFPDTKAFARAEKLVAPFGF